MSTQRFATLLRQNDGVLTSGLDPKTLGLGPDGSGPTHLLLLSLGPSAKEARR